MDHDVTPREAVELYLQDRKTGTAAEATVYSHQSRLSFFIEWCEEADIESMSELSGLHIHQYRSWRADGIEPLTLKASLDTLKVFLRFCGRIELVDEGLHTKIEAIRVPKGERSKEDMLDADLAQDILAHLECWEYCSRAHIQFMLAWRCGLRLGSLRALDVGDVHPDKRHLSLRHRPETDTPLKNKSGGEREVAIRAETAQVLQDWIDEARPDVTDKYGREPLLATTQGRVARQSVRRCSYAWTRPCMVGRDCPHGRDPDDCGATEYENAFDCPSSLSPHPIRRGSITHWLSEGVDETTVSGRMDVSPDVIEEHYDKRSERQKMESRRQFLDIVDQ
ncbi:tyrosine-type recombinase/integrase [Halobaculum limi]|uniref:tyrosine-type recombinase/integrase n=1 Tax=Halobaculum limi TaxID=3031916 RepID=UPI0024064CBF|nr:site-specific integrase [Halobaculum sp. YSMS11]